MVFVKGRTPEQQLEGLAAAAARTLGLASVQERESSNYCHGHYFVGIRENAEVAFYYLDTIGLEEYLFAVDEQPSDEAHAATIARLLSESGYSCFLPRGAWYRTSRDGRGTTFDP